MRLQIKNNTQAVGLAVGIFAISFVALLCHWASFSLVIPLLVLYGGLFLHYDKKTNIRLFLNLGLLLTLIIALAHFLLRYTTTSNLYLPVAMVGILTMLLFNDLQLAFLMSLISSVIVGILAGADYRLFLTFLMGSLTGVYAMKEARTRWDLIKTGIFVGIMQIVCMILLIDRKDVVLSRDFILHVLRPLLGSGLISVAGVMFTSKIFEFLFGVVTNFSLLELADTNHPLLKRMAIEAPGTYHHSLIVSNLSETAANAIGANGLLTRVGSYYHDIGKLVKPEYFTENQLGTNKHDQLEPSMSRLVILNHVKEGIELGRKYKLNPIIIDFIPQHHGTGLLHYFYQRALEEGAKEGEDVREENFRYSGPKPQTRETAVVLLADSVEGAVRASDDPTPAKIDEVVRKIINNKFIDGQLDECDLTLKDIEQISKTFSRLLGSMYHSRIKYPEKKNGNHDRSRKFTETNSHKSPANHQGRKKNPAS